MFMAYVQYIVHNVYLCVERRVGPMQHHHVPKKKKKMQKREATLPFYPYPVKYIIYYICVLQIIYIF